MLHLNTIVYFFYSFTSISSILWKTQLWWGAGTQCTVSVLMRCSNGTSKQPLMVMMWSELLPIPLLWTVQNGYLDKESQSKVFPWTRFCCPICSKSVIDMSRTWKRMDEEVSCLLIVFPPSPTLSSRNVRNIQLVCKCSFHHYGWIDSRKIANMPWPSVIICCTL